jgi:iron complex outermembrane receptor protein
MAMRICAPVSFATLSWLLATAAVAQTSASPAVTPPEAEAAAQVPVSSDGAARPTINSGIEEILVTARKRAEDVQSVPLSVSAVSGAALERRGIADVKELAATIPSLALLNQTSSRNAVLQVRGIGSSGQNPGIETDVGVYFDGVYQKQAGTVLQSSLLDIEAVEVLRGPQGTLYGRNTPVGAVILRSRAPTQAPEAKFQAGYGNYNTAYLQGYVGGGLGETLAGRISFYGNRHSGYDHNIATGSGINDQDQIGARARIQWKPSDRFTGDLIVFYNFLQNHCCVADNVDPTGQGGIATPAFLAAAQTAIGRPYTNVVGKDHIVDTEENPLEKVKTFGSAFTGAFDINDDLTLSSISAYSGMRVTSPRTAGVSQPVVGVAGTNLSQPVDSFSQEFRLASGNTSRLTYQVGTYLFREKVHYNETRTVQNSNRIFADGTMVPRGTADFFRFGQRTLSASVYGQATFAITDQLNLTGGARYSHDNKHGSSISEVTPGASANFLASFPQYSQPNLRFKESKFTYLVSLQYQITPAIMTYATVSTGWKSGGFNGRLAVVGAPLTFDAETTKNYEVGFKSTLFDRKVLANISLYEMNVAGFQDSTINPVTGSGFIVGNAGDIHARGVEFDLQARPFEQLLLTANGAYLDSKFANYSAAPCYAGAVADGSRPGTCNLDGRTPAFSPKTRVSFGGEFTQPLGSKGLRAFVRGDVTLTSSYYAYAVLDPRSKQGSFTMASGRVGLQGPGDKWTVALWGKNLTNVVTWQNILAVSNGGFISAGGRSGVNSLYGWTNAPRTYGVEGSIKF